MKFRIKFAGPLMFFVCMLCLCGCGESSAVTLNNRADTQDTEAAGLTAEQNKYAQIVSMEDTPIVSYTVPQSTPNILVGLQGYCMGEKKDAIVKGKRLPEVFRVVNATDGQVVYTGNIEESTYNEKQGLYIGYVDFSSVEVPGEYYIQCDIVGRSRTFEIQEKMYEVLLSEVYAEIMECCENKSLTVSEAVMVMQTYEWYPNVFPDADDNEIPDVLTVLRNWVSHTEENGVEKGQEALYAAFLAKFSYHYQKFDYKYATECLQRASTVYEKVPETQTKDSDIFYALTELYRATNHSKYRKQILEYDRFFETNSSYPEQPEYIYGGLTYLVTRHSVDKGLCEFFINHVMARGEEVAGGYTELIHPVSAKNNGAEELLKRVMELACANYVLNNYQYTNIIEEFLHYLMGRNLESVDFYAEGENPTTYLLLLAQLVATAAEHEAQ